MFFFLVANYFHNRFCYRNKLIPILILILIPILILILIPILILILIPILILILVPIVILIRIQDHLPNQPQLKLCELLVSLCFIFELYGCMQTVEIQ